MTDTRATRSFDSVDEICSCFLLDLINRHCLLLGCLLIPFNCNVIQILMNPKSYLKCFFCSNTEQFIQNMYGRAGNVECAIPRNNELIAFVWENGKEDKKKKKKRWFCLFRWPEFNCCHRIFLWQEIERVLIMQSIGFEAIKSIESLY